MTGMRIGFDAKRAFTNASGLGNYSRSLIHSLLRYYPGNEYFAFTPSPGPVPFQPPGLKIMLPTSFTSRAFPSLWRTAFLAKDLVKQKIDIYHGLSNELPRRIPATVGKAVTIHDLIFLRYPQWYPATDRKIYERKFSHACREADVVVAVSEQTKRDIVDCFGTQESKVKVVYQSCGEEFYPDIDSKTLNTFLQRRGLPDRYLLYVGTIEERKNLLTLVKALQKVSGIALVVIGKKKKYFEKVRQYIDANGMQDRLYFPDGITAAELPMVYRSALALVYPSYYEGFGIPVLEALWSGTPVIASSTSALPEAAGPSSLYFNPDDHEELAGKIRLVLNDHALREKMTRDGIDYALQFHPQHTAAGLMNIYQSLSK